MTWFRGNVIDNQILNMVGVGTASGAIASFDTDENNRNLLSLEVAIVAQQASGTPSPSNPLSISGFSSVNAVDCGKNLFGGTFDTFYPLHFSVDTQIKVSANVPASPTVQFAYYDINQTRIDYWGLSEANSNIPNRVAKVLTLPKETYYVKFINSQSSDYQIELGNVNTAFEAYKGTTTPVSLGQTIYGGTAELVGGNGSKTFGYAIFDGSEDETWSMHPTISNVFYIDNALPNAYYDQDVAGFAISNIYEQNAYAPLSSLPNNKFAIGYPNTLRLAVKNTACADLASFKTALSSTPMQVVYKLATPTAFTFTGANIPTLSGVNNVYADSGDVNSLEYLASIGKILLG